MGTRQTAAASTKSVDDHDAAEMNVSLVEAGNSWIEHDLLTRRFHLAGLTPAEIAVVLSSKGLRVKTRHVTETFVRKRLKALGLMPNPSRKTYSLAGNCYRARARTTA